jgi:hypothetical protein
MKNNQTGKAVIGLLIALVVLFSTAFYASAAGWGYVGYGGYYGSASWFYIGGPRYVYHDKSVREGSVGGTGHRGGGVRGGK